MTARPVPLSKIAEAKPVRLQLSRRKGFNLQEHSRAVNGLPAVKVDRSTKWGNPFVVGRDGKREECVRLHTILLGGYICLATPPSVDEQKSYVAHVRKNRWRLKGKNLACWCKNGPCHADVLLEIANAAEAPK